MVRRAAFVFAFFIFLPGFLLFLMVDAGHARSPVGDDAFQRGDTEVAGSSRTERGRSPAEGIPQDLFPEIARLAASDAQAADFFGASVALFETTAVVGAEREDGGPSGPLADAGAAYVFARDAGGPDQWGEVIKLTASDAQAGDHFGRAVAINSDTIVIGAPSFAGPVATSAGAVYIFERDLGGADNWGEAAKITASDPQLADYFGEYVALDGDTLVVGAPGEDGGVGDPLLDSGAVYIFERDLGGPGNWGEVLKLNASDSQALDSYGVVSISGNTIAVGAPGPMNEFGQTIGGVYIYERNAVNNLVWEEITILQSSDAHDQDRFGISVSLDMDTLAVGAMGNWGIFAAEEGHTYIFERNLGGLDNWGQAADLQAANPLPGDWFGASVSVSKDDLLVGAPQAGCLPGFSCGAGFVFSRDQGGPENWGLNSSLISSDLESYDSFGRSTALDEGVLLVSSDAEDGGPGDPAPAAGAAYIYYQVAVSETVYLPVILH